MTGSLRAARRLPHDQNADPEVPESQVLVRGSSRTGSECFVDPVRTSARLLLSVADRSIPPAGCHRGPRQRYRRELTSRDLAVRE